MCNGVEVFSGLAVSDPQPLLRGSLEAGVVPLAFRSQGIDGLKGNGITLDRKSVVVWERHIFGAAGSPGTLVETFMVTGAVMQMRCTLVGTAIFLSGSSVI